ncbi:MAG: 23S rRNA (pseudouridine(1915)-N(3))-methyltransferase RlmH [Hyphomicrobiaceae bacterium]|nr:23S rRNA (pseudouridine(1915)-N(3))-methyltransferase RlmH [Hyphomicrobiaceae bacterium]
MRISIVAIGRLKDGGEAELVARYRERIEGAGRGLALGPLSITEFPESRLSDAPGRSADEGSRLVEASARADVRVILDERGKAMGSEAFARWLASERDQGAREIAFLIGGPDGHGVAVRALPATKLTLGPMTLPHGLVRVILAEQIYRAITILAGHPYHRA